MKEKKKCFQKLNQKNGKDNLNSSSETCGQEGKRFENEGLPFMGVDEQYYRDILVPLYKDKKWIFYYYQSDELARIFIDKYGVKEYDLIEI